DMSALLGVSTAKGVHVEHDLDKSLMVEGDISQLQQVVMNLVINASESMEDRRGDVLIHVSEMQADRAWLDQTVLGDEREEGHYVFVEVQDSGCGMDEDTLQRIFEPFYTTKFTGRGLGMSAMLGIVGSHSGTIHIDSVVDEGTTVRVLFPRTEKTVGKVVADENIEHHGSGTILVVDDEEGVLELAKTLLLDMGYETITAMNGDEALVLFEKHQNNIIAVISDVTMPNMNGQELCQKIRMLDADVKLILSSGYDEGQVFESLKDELVIGFIQKPYSPFTFAKTIQKILKD
ncbi:MAG: ATP-binding protein, partial [Mariprofundaceae bacterium]